MARIRKRRLWVADPDSSHGIVEFRWYYGQPGEDLVGMIDSAEDDADLPPFFRTDFPELVLGQTDTQLTEGRYQFAATGLGDVGNETTPYQHPAWSDVTIDVTAPDPLSGGGIEV